MSSCTSHKKQTVAPSPHNINIDDCSLSSQKVICSNNITITMIEQTKSFDPLFHNTDKMAMIETSPTAATSSASSVATEDYGSTTSRVQSAPYDETTADCYAVPTATPVSPMMLSPASAELIDAVDAMSTTSSTPPSPPPVCVTGKFSNIEHKYHIDPKVLGTGHHGSVRRCIDRTTRQRYAVKSIRKSDPAVKIGGLHREIMLLDQMKHASIIQLRDVFEDEEYLHLVTELCEGGELFDKILDRASRSKMAEEAARVLHEILMAVKYMHQHGIVHRDLKPENILFTSKEEGSPVKIIDFGLARHFNKKQDVSMRTVVGTPYYIDPNVLKKDYDDSCDLWSVGIIAYILLCGYPPFNGSDNAAVYASVRRGTYSFPSSDWKHVSVEGRDFIRRLLQVNVSKRMTIDQALRHPWMARHTASMKVDRREEIETVSSVEVIFRRGNDVVCAPQSPPQVNRRVRRNLFGAA
ncbi:serine/threonine-protein kinase [Skeletonema marinoi]|uniref:Serine/threonine-protein kinase n=1 Tax=Skeletonema marinoi TaxID=267567 RepID=A0AAD8Y8Q8_9STRA|nr:serine/threonine-protein kinase [Skeletonema marinoi]